MKKRIILFLILTTVLASAVYNGPKTQNIPIILGTSGAGVSSVGFNTQFDTRGYTNWCDVFYPFKLKDFTISLGEGESATLYVTFATNTLLYTLDGYTNTVKPQWFPIQSGESLAVDGIVTKIYFKGISSYRIIGHAE